MYKWEKAISQKFGRLVVLSRDWSNKRLYFNCLCDCGNHCVKSGSSVLSGDTKSCGCLKKEVQTKHGMCDTITYTSWCKMVARVNGSYRDPINSKYYEHVTLDPNWQDFTNFYKDMGERPNSGYTLDRIDSEKGYCKDNCRWANKTTQARNTRKKETVGTFYRKDRGKWQAQIRVKGKTKYLGIFNTLEEAINARKEAEDLYW